MIGRFLLNLLLWLFGWPSAEEFDYFPKNNGAETVVAARRHTHGGTREPDPS